MNSKKILVENSERDIVIEAMQSSENEKLDIMNFVVGGLAAALICNEPPDFKAYADSTYVKKGQQ